jgi:hypothetical protein
VIERVAQHQTRFRTPGLTPDSRGVALGPLAVILLPGIERLVAFLRATGEEGALDELLESLRIVQVLSPLRTRELVVEVQSGSSHRLDRLAAIARLVGAMVFTGSGRHFVKYRDAQAPFGYDLAELLPDPQDYGLYHDRFAQPYKSEKVLSLRELLLRLAPTPVPRARLDAPRLLYALVHHGLGPSIIGYLARWSVPARVALVEWSRGGTSDVIDRSYLFQLQQPAARFVSLLRSLPGVRLFVPDGERAVVELGHRHPVPLSACALLFGSEELVLFRAGGDGPIPLASRPPFVDLQALTSLVETDAKAPAQSFRAGTVSATFALPLKLIPSGAPPRRVAATVIPLGEQDALGRVLSVLPPATLNRISVAFSETSIYLYGPDAAHVVPLGTLYEELGEGVLVPLGWNLSPPIPPEVVRQLARAPLDLRLFVTGGAKPLLGIPQSAFVPATRILIAELPVWEDSLLTPPLDADRALPDLWPAPPGALVSMLAPGARNDAPAPRGLPPERSESEEP